MYACIWYPYWIYIEKKVLGQLKSLPLILKEHTEHPETKKNSKEKFEINS